MKRPRPDHDLPPERSVAPFPNRWQRWRARFGAFDLRDFWWRLLDRWEASRRFRRWVYALVALAVVLAGAGFGIYPWWTKRNAIKIAREWLDSGHYQYAVDAVQLAMKVAPESPEPWQIAAELARIGGQKDKAVDYAHHAANLAPGDPGLLIGWATEALRADKPGEAEQVLTRVPADDLAKSSQAQRLLGELARRRVQLTKSQAHFEAALRLDGPGAIDEVPLGVVLLNATDPKERQRGVELLAKWTGDKQWGLATLRQLVQDALAHDDKVALLKWAEALRQDPGFTVGDMPTYLVALGSADESRFKEVIAGMEKDHAVNPEAALQLLSWLNQIGRSAEAVRWMQTLPTAGLQRPPLAVAAAEAYRQVADWSALQAWTEGKNWGPEADFLRWAYGLQAARKLGDKAKADELWQTLYSHAQLNSVHALFAGSTIYTWGLTTEAEALWWRAAGQEGQIAIDALGSLGRYYQQQRDAEGQYRVFRQLHLLKPQEAGIGNNFAFFAALTGRDQHTADEVARANLTTEPQNPTYVATRAFILFMQKRPEESLALLQPLAGAAGELPAVVFVRGLALAGTGHKPEAKALLGKIPSASLTKREVEVMTAASGD